jgi:hypothetical protein
VQHIACVSGRTLVRSLVALFYTFAAAPLVVHSTAPGVGSSWLRPRLARTGPFARIYPLTTTTSPQARLVHRKNHLQKFPEKKRRFRERLLSIFEILYCSEKVVEFWLWERLSVTVRKGPREVPYEPLRTVCFALGCHTFPYKTATVANDRCEPNAA